MRTRHRAFTLIELMVVIGIIALLVAMLLPALSAARNAAKARSTQATLAALEMGLETFRSDATLGGAYPPSMSPGVQASGVPVGSVVDPRQVGNATIGVQGATLMAWALGGADMQGAPVEHFRAGWPALTAGGSQAGPGGLYTIDNVNNRPFVARRGPFVELAKMNIPKRPKNDVNPLPRYEVPVGVNHPLLPWICFLDNFDRPILYYRANVGVGFPASATYPHPVVNDLYAPDGTYSLADNAGFTGIGVAAGGYTQPGFDVRPYITKPNPLGIRGVIGPTCADVFTQTNRESFAFFVGNESITTVPTAQRADSYLLISAGPDGFYGTADDVTNFKQNY